MKKLFLIVIVSFSTLTLKAQWTESADSSTMSTPDHVVVGKRLYIKGADFHFGTNSGRPVGTKTEQRALVHNTSDRLFLNYNGDFEGGLWVQGPKSIFYENVGIGTTNPEQKLHVFNNDATGLIARFGTTYGQVFIAAEGGNTANPSYGSYLMSRNADNTQYKDFGIKTSTGIPQLIVKTNGNVGIGTSTTGTHKLAVEGSIGSREIVVEATGWSDYVFANDYHLQPLEKVEEFINQNNHLPEIPSEAEVLENGINLGEMDAKLLQKIEELTLHMIEMNKRVKLLEEENKRLKAQQK